MAVLCQRVVHSNHGSISYSLREKRSFQSKITNFLIPAEVVNFVTAVSLQQLLSDSFNYYSYYNHTTSLSDTWKIKFYGHGGWLHSALEHGISLDASHQDLGIWYVLQRTGRDSSVPIRGVWRSSWLSAATFLQCVCGWNKKWSDTIITVLHNILISLLHLLQAKAPYILIMSQFLRRKIKIPQMRRLA